MIKLELDWAANDTPDTGVVSNDGDDVIVIVEYDDAAGPSGWPTVVVYLTPEPGTPAYRASMELDAWLERVYGMDDEEERQDLARAAVDC